MKKTLLLLLIATVYSCSTGPDDDEFPVDGEFQPVLFQGNLEIYGEDSDCGWLSDFYKSGYNVVVGDLHISGIRDTTICDLSRLGNIVEVYGSVIVSESVLSAEIFSELRKVGGALEFDDVDMKSLAPLASIEEAGSIAFLNLSLDEGVVFSSIDTTGYIDLKYIEIDGDIRFPGITRTSSIEINSFTGGAFDFPKCKTVENLKISNSDLLNLNGISTIEEVGYFLEIRDNENLESIEALEKLYSAQRIWISGNTNLGTLNGLENLSEISRFEIVSNDNLFDYCAVQPSVWAALSNSDYFVIDNKYNPQQEDLISGRCTGE